MSDVTGLGAGVSTGVYESQASRLLQQAQSGAAFGPGESAKIEKSAHDFESILLGSWLQQAEKSFASVPGGDEDDDGDPGKDQFQSLGMQSLAGSLVSAGGVGIAGMIATQLTKSAKAEESGHTASEKVGGGPAR